MTEITTSCYQIIDEVHEASQISQIADVSQDRLQILRRVFHDERTWRVVSLMSSVVGLLSYALSPSFNRLIGRWKHFKIFLYAVLSLAILYTILFAKKIPIPTRYELKSYTSFAVLVIISISMYPFFYDKAVDGKPEVLSIVSNAAFALLSLSLQKLIKFEFEFGMFTYFLGCFAFQLFTVN